MKTNQDKKHNAETRKGSRYQGKPSREWREKRENKRNGY